MQAQPTSIDSQPRLMTAEEVIQIRENMARLLVQVGEPGVCRGCHAAIFWVRDRNGKLEPYDPNGLNHFITCPQAKEFKR